MITCPTQRDTTEKLLKRALTVAHHYGFTPLETLGNAKASCSLSTLPQQLEREFAKTLSEYLPNAVLDQPRLVYRIRTSTSTGRPTTLSLHVFGAPQAIAEAVLVKTTVDILDDLSHSNTEVFLNGIGERDSVARFSRELTLYLRKHAEALPVSAREAMKKDVLIAYSDLVKRQHEICETAPTAMQYMTEPARAHLRSFLECLENIGVAYEFDPYIVGHRDCFNKTLFEIRNTEAGDAMVYARGGRYDEMAKRLFKTTLPAAGVVLEFEHRGRPIPETLRPRIRKPKVCFIQLGAEAKVRSLTVIEHLRRANIPLHQTLYHERLSEQLATAEELGVPYTIIMGQKEALEGSVIVRNMSSRAQETVPIESLSHYLKTL